MPVEVSIRGPVLALRQQLDDQSEKLRETSSTNAALRARIARFERQEQVLHDALLAAETSLGSSQCEGSNLHQQVAALRSTAESAAESQRQAASETQQLRQQLAAQQQRNQRMAQELEISKASLQERVSLCSELSAELSAHKRSVRSRNAPRPFAVVLIASADKHQSKN